MLIFADCEPVAALAADCEVVQTGAGRAHNVAPRHRTIPAPADSELLLASQPFRPVRSGKGSDVTMVFDGQQLVRLGRDYSAGFGPHSEV